jgi:hypothetical protein
MITTEKLFELHAKYSIGKPSLEVDSFARAIEQLANEESGKRIAELEAACMWALYRHQGSSSQVGLPIRRLLGIGLYDSLPDDKIKAAKCLQSQAPSTPHYEEQPDGTITQVDPSDKPNSEAQNMVDAEYFKKKLVLVLRDIQSYSADELSRELLRLSNTAAPQQPPKDAQTVRDVRQTAINNVCINGHLNKALDEVLLSHEPDGTFCILGWLATAAIDEVLSLLPIPRSRIAKDAVRLDFILDNLAFISETVSRNADSDITDSDITTYQLYTQDEDENYITLSGDGKYFKSKREAIDAAMQSQQPTGE